MEVLYTKKFNTTVHEKHKIHVKYISTVHAGNIGYM